MGGLRIVGEVGTLRVTGGGGGGGGVEPEEERDLKKDIAQRALVSMERKRGKGSGWVVLIVVEELKVKRRTG